MSSLIHSPQAVQNKALNTFPSQFPLDSKETFAFFCKVKKIPSNINIFNQLVIRKLFFLYFLADNKYYLFIYGYGNNHNVRTLIGQNLDVIEVIDKNIRKFRSLRGFFLRVSEIIETSKKVTFLQTNCSKGFWSNLPKILRQKSKKTLHKFLFGTFESQPNYQLILEHQSILLENQ